MVPMRMVSPCACARVQSRLTTAAAAAVPFSSDLREVGMTSSLPRLKVVLCGSFPALFREVSRGGLRKSTYAAAARLLLLHEAYHLFVVRSAPLSVQRSRPSKT